MTILDKLERRLGRFAIPHLTFSLMLGQILAFGLIVMERLDSMRMILFPALVLEGEVWRVVTFLFHPPLVMHPIFLIFAWYIFYLMGTALEHQWGNFRYNIFLLIAWVATASLSFLAPAHPVTNAYIMGSVFLAFAFLNPDFELALFLILPIKVKWLAYVTWGLYALTLLFGPLGAKLAVVAAILNFVIFFGKDLIRAARTRQRRLSFEAERAAEQDVPLHRCHVCGRTDRTNPELEFRYCSKCADNYCYCEEHLHNHEHIQEPVHEGE